MKHRATSALSKLRTDGERPTHLDDDLPVYNVENIQMTSQETTYVHVCTQCNVENHFITGRPDEDPTDMKETRASTVQPTKRQATKGEVPTIE